MVKITAREWSLAIIFAVVGIFVSSRWVILALDGLSPLLGFLVYYAIVILCLFCLSKLGLTVFDIKIEKFGQIIGSSLIIFSFFILFNWTSPYVQYVTTGSLEGASNVFYQCEDGVTWYLWSFLFDNVDALRIFTYVITPFLLTLLGGLLIEKKVKLGP